VRESTETHHPSTTIVGEVVPVIPKIFDGTTTVRRVATFSDYNSTTLTNQLERIYEQKALFTVRALCLRPFVSMFA
jgi:hypothetical protein